MTRRVSKLEKLLRAFTFEDERFPSAEIQELQRGLSIRREHPVTFAKEQVKVLKKASLREEDIGFVAHVREGSKPLGWLLEVRAAGFDDFDDSDAIALSAKGKEVAREEAGGSSLHDWNYALPKEEYPSGGLLELLSAAGSFRGHEQLHDALAVWGEERSEELWAALPELRQRLGKKAEAIELELTDVLAEEPAEAEAVAEHWALIGRARQYASTYVAYSNKRRWDFGLEAMVRNLRKGEGKKLVAVLRARKGLAKSFAEDVAFAAARHGAKVEVELSRYAPFYATAHSHDGWAFEGAEKLEGWSSLMRKAKALPGDTLDLIRLLGDADEGKRRSIKRKLKKATDMPEALAAYLDEIAQRLRDTQDACYSISDRSWVMSDKRAGALKRLPMEHLRTLEGHPELRFCARGLLERNSGVKDTLLALLDDDEREDLLLDVVDTTPSEDCLAGILSIVPFETSESARTAEFDALEHLVACGHPVSDLKAYRHVAVVFGYGMGPARRRSIDADLKAHASAAGWTTTKFQPIWRLMRSQLRRCGPKDEARFEKRLALGRELVEEYNAPLETLEPLVLAAARRLRRDKKLSKTRKLRGVEALAALWGDAVCTQRGWERLMGKGLFGPYKPVLLSPRHRSVLELVRVEEHLAKAKPVLPVAADGRNARPFEYRRVRF